MDDPRDIRIRLLRGLLRSPLGLRLVRALLAGRPQKPHHYVSADFFLEMARSAYASRARPVVWSNIFVPSELFWGLGIVPFFPETWAGLAASMGLSALGVSQSAAVGYPVDLCTVHRSAAGLWASQLFPRIDAGVATSHACDLAGQMVGNFAYAKGKPFFLLDVPQNDDEAAVDYLAAQLGQLIEHWRETLGIAFDPDRLREAIRLSNQARALALEVATLREAEPAPLRGSGMRDQLGMLTAMFGHPSGIRYYQALRDYTAQRVADGQPEQAHQRVRLYWMHLMPYFESALLSILEDELGGAIAWEEISTVWWDELDEREPLRSLARKIVSLFFNGPIQRRAEMALRLIRRYHCQGAIHFSHWGCRQSAGALYVLRAHLRREGVPLLILDGDCIDPSNLQLGPLRTRIEAFMEMLS